MAQTIAAVMATTVEMQTSRVTRCHGLRMPMAADPTDPGQLRRDMDWVWMKSPHGGAVTRFAPKAAPLWERRGWKRVEPTAEQAAEAAALMPPAQAVESVPDEPAKGRPTAKKEDSRG